MDKVIIFGTSDISQIAHYYIILEKKYEVVAFTVDKEYINRDKFCGLPLIAFEDITEKYPPSDYKMFVAISYAKVNKVREKKYLQAKSMGYSFISYIDSRASIAPNAVIGENCFIFEDNTIQPFVEIGNNVTLWSGNHIGHHSKVHDHCFISSHVVVSGGVEIKERCFIGVNSTLRDHITIGEECVLGAGCIILKDAPDRGVYVTKETEMARIPSNRLRKI